MSANPPPPGMCFSALRPVSSLSLLTSRPLFVVPPRPAPPTLLQLVVRSRLRRSPFPFLAPPHLSLSFLLAQAPQPCSNRCGSPGGGGGAARLRPPPIPHPRLPPGRARPTSSWRSASPSLPPHRAPLRRPDRAPLRSPRGAVAAHLMRGRAGLLRCPSHAMLIIGVGVSPPPPHWPEPLN